MRQVLRVCFALSLYALPAVGQTTAEMAAKEAEIKAAVPFGVMLSKFPVMTLEQYNAAVRALAQRELRTSVDLLPNRPTYGTSLYESRATPQYTAPSSLSSTTGRIGSFSYYSDSRGVTGSTTGVGPYSYSNYSNGVSATATQIDPYTFYTIRQQSTTRPGIVTGTTTTLGQFRFHNFSNGVTGTTTQLGQFGFTNLSNGKRCTTTTVGSYTYTNCY
jgi:hypothetical protein